MKKQAKTELEKQIIERIELERRVQNLTKLKLAEKAGCTNVNYGNIVNHKSSPTLGLTCRLLQALKINIKIVEDEKNTDTAIESNGC